MGLENVLHRLGCASASRAAEVAEVLSDRAACVRGTHTQRLHRSCRGQNQTSAPASATPEAIYEGNAEVAEVSNSFTHTPAHAPAHAREQQVDAKPLQPVQPLQAPGPVTLLKHCRCMDCRRFYKAVDGEFYCESYIGGTRIEWATGKRSCDPPPDAWHYCADYHGPQISKDVWAWPRRPHAEVAGVAGPSGESAEDNRGGNGHEAGLFRSPARTQGKEA